MTSTVEKIVREVKSLPREQLEEFLSWLADFENGRMDEWDKAVVRDCRPGGRLREVVEKAERGIAAGETRPLDELLDDR